MTCMRRARPRVRVIPMLLFWFGILRRAKVLNEIGSTNYMGWQSGRMDGACVYNES